MRLTRRMTQLVAVVLVVVCASAVSSAAAGDGRAAARSTKLATFSIPGTYVWKVPAGISTVTFDVAGASGGNVLETLPGPIINLVSQGGNGGHAKGQISVHAGEWFEIVVGGRGGTVNTSNTGGSGGFNGGGAGVNGDYGGAGGGGVWSC